MITKALFISLFALASMNSFAHETKLQCKATYNMDTVLETEVTLGHAERNKSFGEYEGFQFFLSDNGSGIVELQSLNIYEPSRSYATAKISEAGSFVELSIWTREYILEVRCTK
jgi:hypothetical protein